MSNHLTVVESDTVVVSMKRASMALAEAVTISQTKKILDVAAAAEIYAKRQHLSEEAEQLAATVKVEALRKLGEMLQATPKAKGVKGQFTGGTKSAPPAETAPTLAELGLTKKESAVAQKLAALPEKSFQQVRDGHVTVAKAIAAVDATKRPAPAPAPAVVVAQAPAPSDDDFGPSEEEIFQSERAIAADMERVRLVLESDDALAAMTEKCKQQAAMIDKQDWRIRGLVNENADLLRRLKSAMNKLDRIEKSAA